MLDFRYHAISLVAVFLALTVGLLLGVAIGDKGLVSNAGNSVRRSLEGDVRDANSRAADLRRKLRERNAFEQDAYPLLVNGRLQGERVGIIALGGLSNRTISDVRDALKDTGGRLASVAVIREPIPDAAVPSVGALTTPTAPVLGKAARRAAARRAAARRAAARRKGSTTTAKPPTTPTPSTTPSGPTGATVDTALLKRFGSRIGTDFTQGGKLLKASRRTLLSSSSGSFNGVETVVLVRAATDLKGDDQIAVTAFEEGLVAGLTAQNTPVVGVETTTTDPSQIGWFSRREITSVDNLDALAGRAALVFALGGASGQFGTKSSAQGLLPKAVG